LEQVHVTGLIRRSLRLPLTAAMTFALAMPALAVAAQDTEDSPAASLQARPGQTLATETMLTTETHDQAGRTQTIVTVSVTGEDRLPASGAVTISDSGRPLAGAALNAQGKATLNLDLPGGDHALSAAYIGDSTHRSSVSRAERVRAMAGSATPDFAISVAPTSLSLVAGASGSLTASIAPLNSAALTAPMFLTLSCSGLPDQSSCSFTPLNVEILPNAKTAVTSSMLVLTQRQSFTSSLRNTSPLALAILLPGALGLGGLAWSLRSRPWMQRLTLMALVGLVAMLGTTACNARYDYYHHGPPPNLPTPAGTYTINVTAQSTDGVSATTRSTTFVLTVK
jgi:hypothetical protein